MIVKGKREDISCTPPNFNLVAYQQLHLKENNSAVRSFRASLYSANLLLLVRSPLKQSMDFLTEALIAACEHDLTSRVHRVLELSETARERCALSFPMHLLSSPTSCTPQSPRAKALLVHRSLHLCASADHL